MKSIFIALFLAGLSCTVSAQRPKIGLTLSGGGAKGLSHIGILQALDSAGLQVDYITGTSMGSIIGAMYASGYSGNQIDSIARKLDWDVLLSGKPKYTDVRLDEKDEFGKYSFEIPFDGLTPKMGTGLIESEEIWLQFNEVFFHVYDQKDFQKFSIPFKCIATDLSNGKPVVFDKGELVLALRASMAIPSILSSVKYGDTELVDGGIVRNFPVSDVIGMGADYTIGVNLFSGLSKVEDLNSALDVMYQVTNYRDADDLVKQKKLCNILIEPPLEGYSAGSFSSAEELLQIGYDLREKYYPIFKNLADSLKALEEIKYNPYSRFKPKNDIVIDAVEIEGLETLNDEMVLRKLGLVTGKAYDAKDLNNAFRNAYSTLYFQYIYYELHPNQEGHAIIKVKLKEQYEGQFKLGFSFHSFTSPAAILNYTGRNLIFDKSRSMIKIAISEDVKGLLEHRQFFGENLNSALTLSLKLIEQKIPIYNEDIVSNQYKTANLSVELAYNYYIKKYGSVGEMFAFRNTSFSPDIASTFRFDGYNRDLYLKLNYQVNSTDRPFLPTSGTEAQVNAGMEFNRTFQTTYSGNDTLSDSLFRIYPVNPLFRFDFYVNNYKKLGARTTILTNIQGGMLLLNDEQNFYLDNLLVGGQQKLYRSHYPFVGYYDIQVPATSFASLLLGVQYNVYGEFYLLGKGNVGIYSFINKNGFIDGMEDRIMSGFSASLAYNLSMLPFELSFNYSPEYNQFFSHVRIGFIF